MKIYKYASITDLHRILLDDEFSLKFSYPRDYNDPLELFLTPSGTNDDFIFAYYHHLLGELPQLPTTCFSCRPDVLPMWAHYGGNHTGFLIEIDERLLIENFEVGVIHDIEYKGEIGFCDIGALEYAATTCKPRHVFRARSIAFRSAYFTKSDCWAYECERRLVLDETVSPFDSPLMVRRFPASCITALISGCRCDAAGKEALREAATRYQCKQLQIRIGKSMARPYFVGGDDSPTLFQDGEIVPAEFSCGSCGDPIEEDAELCAWCNMSEDDATAAALSDPMRLYALSGVENPYGIAFAGIPPVGSMVGHH